MKKILFANLFGLAILCTLFACKPEEEPTLSVSPDKVDFTAEGGNVNIAITTNQETFDYSCPADWLTLAPEGMSLTLSAPYNTVTEVRTTTVTISAGGLNQLVEVTQAPGSKYPGYEKMNSVSAYFYGYMMARFYDMPESDGGYAMFDLKTADGMYRLSAELFTEPFESEEDVTFVGKFTAGSDDYGSQTYVGKKMTFVPGGNYVITDEEGDEEFIGGTYLVTTINDAETYTMLKDGSITVTAVNDDEVLILVDLVDAQGNDCKWYYEGEMPIDTESTVWTNAGGEHGDATAVTEAYVMYNGDAYGAGTTNATLYLCAEDGIMTTISYNCPAMTFEEFSQNITGEWYSEENNTYAAGTANLGSLLEMEGFSFPMDSYVFYDMNDYLVPDAFVSLIIEAGENGTYNVSSALMNNAMDFLMFDLKNIEIPVYDGTDEEEYED